MRQLHWQPVDNRQVDATIWKELNDTAMFAKLDLKDFEAMFGETAKAPVVADKEAAKPHKKELHSVLDPNRARNINIVLARVKLSPRILKTALLSMDETVFTEDISASLAKVAPTAEEIEALQSYQAGGGDVAELAPADAYFLEISSIPNVGARLEALLFKAQFAAAIAEVDENLGKVEAAQRALRSSNKLRGVLEIVLAMGNYLNAGTKKSGAYGFRLSALNKLSGTKGNEAGATLLSYIIKTIDQKQPDLAGFLQELEPLHAAARIELPFLQGEVSKLTGSLAKFASLAGAASNDPKDRFGAVMSAFLGSGASKGDKAKARVEAVNSAAKDLAILYGEDAKLPFHELCGIFDGFVKEYTETSDAIKKKEEDEKKAASRKPLMAGRHAGGDAAAELAPNVAAVDMTNALAGLRKRPVKKTGEDDGQAGGADAALSSMKGTSAASIRAAVQARRAANVNPNKK